MSKNFDVDKITDEEIEKLATAHKEWPKTHAVLEDYIRLRKESRELGYGVDTWIERYKHKEMLLEKIHSLTKQIYCLQDGTIHQENSNAWMYADQIKVLLQREFGNYLGESEKARVNELTGGTEAYDGPKLVDLPDAAYENLARWIDHKGLPDELIEMFANHFGPDSEGPKMMRNERTLFAKVAEILRDYGRIKRENAELSRTTVGYAKDRLCLKCKNWKEGSGCEICGCADFNEKVEVK